MAGGGKLKAVKDVLDNAIEPPIDGFWEDMGRDPDGGDPDGGDGPRRFMPPGCPVEPLGTEGGVFYFLTALGELRGLKARDIGNKDIGGLFAPLTQYLYDQWPATKQIAVTDDNGETVKDAHGKVVKEWVVTGWKTAEVSELLMDVAAGKGVWNPQAKVRGRGAWADEDGRLILHCGNQVLIGGGWKKPGEHGGFVYPTAPPVPRPNPERSSNAAAVELLGILKSWNWARPTIDPMLLLGWITIARLGGAIDWRPLVWITGGAATGKSTLMNLIKALFDGGLLPLGDATEAAIRQLLGQDTLPVLLDESEAEEDDRKLQAILRLARIAASGEVVGKGGQDHKGVEFRAQSCFIFASILLPSLQPQDKSRFAVLELGALPAGGRMRKIEAAEKRSMGSAIARRIVDHWGRWPRTLEMFRDAFIDYGGHKSRGADVFGTLLAAAHIALEDDDPEEEELAEWGRRLAADRLAELSDNDSDAQRCLYHLGTSLVQLAGHGTPRLVADWVAQATRPGTDQDAQRSAREQLGKVGISVTIGRARKAGEDEDLDRPRPVPGRTYIAVANAHQGLGRLFAESQWKGRAGASGVWSQSLKRVDGAVPNERQRIGGMVMACTLVPIEALIDSDTPGGASAAEAAREAEHA